jgi:hypothetical protein
MSAPTGPSYNLDPPCSLCGVPMYRHPIILWALQCLRCDRPDPPHKCPTHGLGYCHHHHIVNGECVAVDCPERIKP